MSTETRIERFGPADFDALTDLWEASVRATHTFLLQGEVERLRPMVRNACLESADIYGMRGQDGRPVAFREFAAINWKCCSYIPRFSDGVSGACWCAMRRMSSESGLSM